MFLQNVTELLFDYTAPYPERVAVVRASNPVEELSVQSLANDGNCLFQRFHPFVVFIIIQNNAQLHINIREGNKMFVGKEECADNVEIIAVSEMYCLCFPVSEHLSRLHMILKPFMLRRIKKDVENELSDKIEVMVYCPLTTRQKLLYSGMYSGHPTSCVLISHFRSLT